MIESGNLDGWRFTSAAVSHTGSTRKRNEDALLELPGVGLWCVADGMGGHSAGDLASRSIVQALETLREATTGASLPAQVQQLLQEVNDRLHGEASGRGTTIGSTVAVLLAHRDRLECIWAGDSRIGRYRHGRLTWLTRDHSYVQELVDRGQITGEQAGRHPMRNLITRALGTDPGLQLETCHAESVAGDLFLLCSDGLLAAVPIEDINRIMSRGEPDEIVENLLAQALDNVARDNVSMVVVRIDTAPGSGTANRGDPDP